jgi:hypothetical protein
VHPEKGHNTYNLRNIETRYSLVALKFVYRVCIATKFSRCIIFRDRCNCLKILQRGIPWLHCNLSIATLMQEINTTIGSGPFQNSVFDNLVLAAEFSMRSSRGSISMVISTWFLLRRSVRRHDHGRYVLLS